MLKAERKVKIKLELMKKGMTQMRMAQALGISESLLSRVINGHMEAKPDIRKGLSDLLGVPEETLFGSCGSCSGDCECEN